MSPRPSPRRPDLKVVSSTTPPVAAPAAPDATDFSQLLRDNLAAVGEAVRFVSSRNRLSADMTEELNSRALLHLVDHDYAVLRQWRRECSLPTYLTTVITRVFLDLRNKEWGKAKPPAIARRLGAVALMLWRLTHRARLSFDEAVKTLQAEHGVQQSRDELWAMYAKLPAPSGRYFVGVSELAEMEQPGADAEVLVHQIERRRLAARVERGLARALHGLADEDRLILKLFFHDGMFLAEIARLLDIDQPRLYPRFRGLMASLRAALESQGLSAADVAAIVGVADLGAGGALLASTAKIGQAGPSVPVDDMPVPQRRRVPRES
jgi:RNA polymerase sigma factor (sigma-70 family)